MGKSTPKAPDYRGAAEETAASNQEAMTRQTHANRIDQNNPWGSVSYESEAGIDPATGLPITSWTQNTTLDPRAQEALNSQLDINADKSAFAKDMIGQAGDSLADPMDTGWMEDWGWEGESYDRNEEQLSNADMQGVSTYGGGNLNNSGLADPQALDRNIGALDLGGMMDVNSFTDRNSNLNFTASTDELNMWQDALTNQGLENVSMFDASGGLDNYGLQESDAFDDFGGLDNYGLQEIEGSGQQRLQAEDAVYDRNTSRLDPKFEQAQNKLNIDLQNRGLTQGDEAYDEAMDNFAREKTDAYQTASNESIMAGGREAERNFGMDMQNRQNQFGERGSISQDEMARQGQRFNQETGNRDRTFDEFGDMSRDQMAREGQQYNQELGSRGEIFGELAGMSQDYLTRQGQMASQQGDNYDRAFSQQQGMSQDEMAREQQLYDQQMGARGQQYTERQGMATNELTRQGQNFDQMANNRDAEWGQRVGMNNATRADSQLANAQQAALRSQQFNERQAISNTARDSQAQQFSQQMDVANYQNSLRAAQMQEEASLRQMPLNELNALLSGTQVNAPEFQQFNQAGNAGGTDYSGAAQNQFAADSDVASMGNANMQSMFSGATSLAGMMSDRRLKRFIKKVGDIGKLSVYSFQYLWSDEEILGFMSDEVAEIVPEAVFVTPSGFDAVNYDIALAAI